MSTFIISTTSSDEEEKPVSQVLQLTTAQKRDEISVITLKQNEQVANGEAKGQIVHGYQQCVYFYSLQT